MRASIVISRLFVLLLSVLLSSGCASTYRYLPWGQPTHNDQSSPTASSSGAPNPTAPNPAAPSLLGGVPGSPSAVVGQGEEGAKAPLAVSVAQAFFVGEQLHVKVRLEAKTSLPTEEIVVSVLGLKEGQVVEKHHQLASRLTADSRLSSGQSLLIPFALAAKDLSEYQVQCRWGADAVQIAKGESLEPSPAETAERADDSSSDAAQAMSDKAPANTAPLSAEDRLADDAPEVVTPRPGAQTMDTGALTSRPQVAESNLIPNTAPSPDESARASLSVQAEPGKLAIKDVELEEETVACDSPPCDRRYVLRARVQNTGGSPLSDVELGVGLAWAEGGGLPKPPADYEPKRPREETVGLKQIVLRSGDSKKLKIKIDRAVPVVPGGAFVPYIRIIQSKTAS